VIAPLNHQDVEEDEQRIKEMGVRQVRTDVDIVELFEQMLFQRAAQGIRPVLYVSSYTDLECSMLMLLDETSEARTSGTQQPVAKGVGYHVVTN
jgi:hypothetical protein